VRSFEAWSRLAGLPGSRGAGRYCDAYAAGQVQAPDWVRATVRDMCAKSLLTWQRTLARDGVKGLAGAYKPRQAQIDLDGDLASTAEGLIHDRPHLKASALHDALVAYWPERKVPGVRAVQAWLSAWKLANAQVFEHLNSPDAWRSTRRPGFGTAGADITRLNQLWEADSTPGDLQLVDGRYTVLGLIDVYSRRARLKVWPTSSAEGGGLVLRKALLDFGVPEQISTDNGADYVSRQYTRVLSDLGIEQHLAPKFSPEKKPFIERFFGTFSRGLVELLPGYSGHSVAEAAAIRSRTSFAKQLMTQGTTTTLKLTAAEFQDICDRWLTGYYENRKHSSIGTTPAQRAASFTGWVKRIADERALDVLLAPLVGGRTVTKKGIRIDGGIFIAPELGSHVGSPVEVRRDPADLGRIYVFDAEGCFLCVAYDPDRVGIDRVAVAQAAKRIAQDDVLAARRRMREAAKGRPKGEALHDAIIQSGQRQASQVVAFPRPAAAHSTAALAAHGRAARADEAPQAPVRTIIDEERSRRFAETERARADKAGGNAARAEKEARTLRGLRLLAAEEAGADLAPDDAAWFGRYRTTPEFRSALHFAREGNSQG
jgi:transposase InsO family protein